MAGVVPVMLDVAVSGGGEQPGHWFALVVAVFEQQQAASLETAPDLDGDLANGGQAVCSGEQRHIGLECAIGMQRRVADCHIRGIGDDHVIG